MTTLIIIAVVAAAAFVGGILVGKANAKAVAAAVKTTNVVVADATKAVADVKAATK